MNYVLVTEGNYIRQKDFSLTIKYKTEYIKLFLLSILLSVRSIGNNYSLNAFFFLFVSVLQRNRREEDMTLWERGHKSNTRLCTRTWAVTSRAKLLRRDHVKQKQNKNLISLQKTPYWQVGYDAYFVKDSKYIFFPKKLLTDYFTYNLWYHNSSKSEVYIH